MYGLDPQRPAGDPLHAHDAGARRGRLHLGPRHQLRPDLRALPACPASGPAITTRLESVVGPKQTGVGEGYFVTTQNTWWVGRRAGRDDDVPGAQVQARRRRRRPRRRTVAAGDQPRHRLLLGRYGAGRAADPDVQRLRRAAPPARSGLPVLPRDGPRPRRRIRHGHGRTRSWCTTRPRCPARSCRCRSPWSSWRRACGWSARSERRRRTRDRRHPSQVVLRPDRRRPDARLVVARRRVTGTGGRACATSDLPPWSLPITPTLIVSTALATRDFQDVHHDRDLAGPARRQGHLPQHPHHHRPGAALRHRLGRPGRRRSPPARCGSGARPTRATRSSFTGTVASRDRRRGRRSTSSARCVGQPRDRSSATVRAVTALQRRGRDRRHRRDRVLQGVGPLRAPALRARRRWPRWPTRG